MADYPDIYSDGFSVNAGPAGVTLTMTLSDPGIEPGPHAVVVHPVVRLRMSTALTRDLITILTDTLAQVDGTLGHDGDGTTH